MDTTVKITIIIVCLFMISISGSCQDKLDLELLNGDYPRAFFFRKAEHISSTDSYVQWSQNFERLMGIEGKALDEEVVGRSDNIVFFNKFKEDHPNQLVLLHFNGNGRNPDYETENFFAGHWLYYNGVKILSDLSDNEEISEIKVADATKFKTDIGRFGNSNEDIGLCRLDAEGKPDWNFSEQVKLLSIDYDNNTIVVKRACYGSRQISLSAGESYAAAHVSSGPWCGGCNLQWFYNYSLRGPKDKNGKGCSEVFAIDVAKRFLPGGELELFDGVEFDVIFEDIRKHYFTFMDYAVNSTRAPDTNADGVSDDGSFEGVNYYGEGVMHFLRQLRDLLGDTKIIMGDGNETAQQRAFGIVNGIESEGWPNANDFAVQGWSAGINRNLFWDRNSRIPKMSYINLKWGDGLPESQVLNLNRMVIAASCLTNSAIAMHYSPEPALDPDLVDIWDELVMGEENKKGWLGEPMGEIVHLAKQSENVLGTLTLEQLYSKLTPVDDSKVTISLEQESIKIESDFPDDMEIILSDIPCSGTDLSLFMNCSALAKENRSPEIGRAFYVTPTFYDPAIKDKLYYSYANEIEFESVFYFLNVQQENFEVKIKIESGEPFYIHSIEAYNHPDLVAREFEKGVIVANPSPDPHQFNLLEIFGNDKFRRLKGSSNQDPATNNGASTGSIVEVNGKDALFIIKTK